MQRNYTALLVAALAVLALATVGAMAAFGSTGAADTLDEESTGDESIAVSATGSVEAAPDSAVVDVSVSAEDDEIETVRDELATGSEELTDALDDLDVEYKTASYDVDQQRVPPEEADAHPEYSGAHDFEVSLDETDRVGEVIDEAAAADAEIRNVELTLSEEKRDNVRDDAIEDAMDDARSQADTIAETGKLTVTGVSSVDATQQSFSPVSQDRYVMEDADDSAPSTAITDGDVAVTYSVDVVYNATR